MFDFEATKADLYVLLAIIFLVLIAYMATILLKRRAMVRKNNAILKMRQQDTVRWNALQEERKKQSDNPPSA
jgi:uncharacterized membrane protein